MQYTVASGTNFTWSLYRSLFGLSEEQFRATLSSMNIQFDIVDGDHVSKHLDYHTRIIDLYTESDSKVVEFAMNFHDIGLIFLNKPMKVSEDGGLSGMQTICLPEEDYKEENGSFGLVAGYGMIGVNRTGMINSYKDFPMQLTYQKIVNVVQLSFIISAYAQKGQGTTCAVSITTNNINVSFVGLTPCFRYCLKYLVKSRTIFILK